MFRSTRVRLAIVYTVGIGLIMAGFSVALYLSLSSAMAINLEVPETASPRVEHAILTAQLARARFALLGLNIAGCMVAALTAYAVAGRALRPIEAALARQRQFTSHASHELRTPLTIMKGEIDVTLVRERPPEEYRRVLETLEDEVDHVEEMVGDLLLLARAESGQSPARRERGHVEEAIQEVIAPLLPALTERNVQLKIEVAPQLEARLDWGQIRHLIANLIDNASSHTPSGGTIAVQAVRHRKGIQMTVSNTGSKIEERDLPHLFVPFYRGTGSHRNGGSGLGLALCDSVVRHHHGSIVVRNEPNGVSFVVRLPDAA